MKRIAVALLVLLLGVSGGCGPGGPLSFIAGGEAPTVLTFEANPLTISAGEFATLTWEVSGAAGVEIDHGIGSVALTGSRTVSPTATTTYTLVATNQSGKSVYATAQVTVSATPPSTAGLPVIDSFTADPPAISSGDSVTLSWTVSNATSMAITPGIGTVASSGSKTVSPSADTTYKLVATNANGSATATVLVSVSGPAHSGVPVINHFTATPPNIHPGGTSTLSWDVTGATAVALDRGIGAVDATGTWSVTPLGTTNYTLTASNSFGHTVQTLPVLVTEAPEPEDEPDLLIVSVSKVAHGDRLVIGYTIRNQGDVSSPPTVSELYVNGVYKTSDSVPAIPAGDAVARKFTGWTYSPLTPAIRVVADASDEADEADEANNEKAVSFAVETVLNYVDKANLADWETGSPQTSISFGGALSDSNGFACHRTNVKLEDGDTYAKVLETHPKWVGSGWIDGLYPTTTIPEGAWFVADVGFLDGAAGTDGVDFRVWFLQSGTDIPNLLDHVSAEYDGDLDRLEIDLADYAGLAGRLGFQVLAGPSSGKDWAVWVNAKMIR